MFENEDRLFKFVIKAGIFFMFIIIVALFFFGIGDNSQGERTGTLIKFSKTGIIFNTYEGEIAMSGFKLSGQDTKPYVFEFSVCNPAAFNTSVLMDNIGKQVKMNYHSPILVKHWQQASNYCIDSIEVGD